MALVQAAIKKTAAGIALKPIERNAWKKWEADEDARRADRFIGQVPKKTYCLWSGRPTKILHDQADLYGVPLRGTTIDVPQVIAWVHDFLARWKHDLAPLVKGDGAEIGGEPGLKEQLLREQVDLYRRRNRLLEDQLELNSQTLVPRGEIHALHLQLAKILRAAGERLQKQFGDQAASILNIALDDFENRIMELVEPKTEEL